MKKLAIVLVLVALALLAGVAVGFGVIDLVNAMMPVGPGESLASHESFPLLAGGLAGLATAIVTLVLGWQRYGDLV